MRQIEMNKITNNKEIIVSSVVTLACLVLSVFFPENNFFQSLTKGFFFFFLIPVLYIKIILKKSPREFGLNVQNKKSGVFWIVLMLIASAALMYLIIRYTTFQKHYSLPSLVVNNFGIFLLYTLVLSGIVLFFQEYFFRGFVLSIFTKRFLIWSAFIQAILFCLVVIISNLGGSGGLWQMIPYFIIAFSGGITAYKSRSMIFSWIGALIFWLAMNAYLAYLIKA